MASDNKKRERDKSKEKDTPARKVIAEKLIGQAARLAVGANAIKLPIVKDGLAKAINKRQDAGEKLVGSRINELRIRNNPIAHKEKQAQQDKEAAR